MADTVNTMPEKTMQAFADVVRQGKALYIGVSEWTADQIRAGHALAKDLGIQLISSQPQYSMLWRVIEGEVVPACEELGISQIVWSPIAQGAVLDDEVIGKIAAAHGKTPSQVTLRWHVERGDIVFPKSMKRERMEENFAIFDFELSPEEIDAISALDRGEDGRRGPNPDTFDYVPA